MVCQHVRAAGHKDKFCCSLGIECSHNKKHIGLNMKFLHICFVWNSRQVSFIYKTHTLHTCLSLYNLISETSGWGTERGVLFNNTVSYSDCTAFIVDQWKKNTGNWQNDTEKWKTKYSAKKLPHCHFLQHDFRVDWPALPQWSCYSIIAYMNPLWPSW